MSIEIELKDITREYLDQSGIYDVREYAREVGVRAPTGMKKQDMIDCILDIRDGKVAPVFPTKAGRGRPPKKPPEAVKSGAPSPEEEKTQGKYRVYVPESAPQKKVGFKSSFYGDRTACRPDSSSASPVDSDRTNGFLPKMICLYP